MGALLQELEAYRAADPLLYLTAGAAAGNDITHPDLRHVRAEALQAVLAKLHRAVRLCDFRNEIVVRPEGVFVDVGGVLMDALHTTLFLKTSREPCPDLFDGIRSVLDRMKIEVATAVDVGANFGQVSLGLARAYPQARVVALEPSSGNIRVFNANKAVQRFPTSGIELVTEAVSDRRGTASFMKGVGSMTRLLAAGEKAPAETVSCDTLDSLFDRHGIRTADFVKIDIEGGEPRLRDAIGRLGERVRSYYIEFSTFAPLGDYLALAKTLLERGFRCRDEGGTTGLDGMQAIEGYLQRELKSRPVPVTNLWFVR